MNKNFKNINVVRKNEVQWGHMCLENIILK